jgi:hypothetical protein
MEYGKVQHMVRDHRRSSKVNYASGGFVVDLVAYEEKAVMVGTASEVTRP